MILDKSCQVSCHSEGPDRSKQVSEMPGEVLRTDQAPFQSPVSEPCENVCASVGSTPRPRNPEGLQGLQSQDQSSSWWLCIEGRAGEGW